MAKSIHYGMEYRSKRSVDLLTIEDLPVIRLPFLLLEHRNNGTKERTAQWNTKDSADLLEIPLINCERTLGYHLFESNFSVFC